MQRRDFLNGMALAVIAGMSPIDLLYGKATKKQNLLTSDMQEYYPPQWLGLRGSNDKSYEFAHLLRDGELDAKTMQSLQTKESYDVVIIGAGISGLASACFYQEKFGKDSKILILDNHDDFGGHARRNEIKLDDGVIISYGGSESFQSPKTLYSKEVLGLLTSLGVDIDNLAKRFDVDFYPDLGLSRGVYFSKEFFGVDKLINGYPKREIADEIPPSRDNAKSIEDFIKDFPLDSKDKQDLLALYKSQKDYLKGMSKEEREAYITQTSYKTFLQEKVKLSPNAIRFFEGMGDDFMAFGIDAISCAEVRDCMPSFSGLGSEGINAESLAELEELYIHHCIDGNATIARLMVKNLIPSISDSKMDMDSIAMAHFDYAKLDNAKNPVRLRLNSTALQVANIKNGAEVVYINGIDKQLYKIKSKKVIMANYNGMIPYIIPTLPQAQKLALGKNVKNPLIYTKVVIDNWESFLKLGVHEIYAPCRAYAKTKLDFPVDIGGYRHPRDPKKPICLHMVCSPFALLYTQGIELAGMDARERARVARSLLYTMSFAEHEVIIRNQLQDMLGSAGFHHQKDILAIVLNRWGHGYSYTFNSLYDDPKQAKEIQNTAKKPFGNIHIANSDSAWEAYMHSAIDEAYRAIQEI